LKIPKDQDWFSQYAWFQYPPQPHDAQQFSAEEMKEQAAPGQMQQENQSIKANPSG